MLRRQAWPLVVVVGALLPFLPLLVGGEIPVARDHLDHFLGKRWLLAQALQGEASLLWNPFRAAGTPFLADPQSGVLYPPALLVFGCLGSLPLLGLATTLYLALHGVLGGLGAWAWLRARGLASGPAALGALAFQSTGFTLSLLDLQNNWCTLAWLPAALFCVEKSLRSRGLRWPAATALVLALSFLAGEPQVALSSALLVAAAWSLHPLTRRRPLPSLARLGLAGLLAAALSAAQALPLVLHARETLRADGIPASLMEEGSFRAIEVLDLFAPSLFEAPAAPGLKLSGTQHWIATLYLGWVPLTLASFLTRRRALALTPWFALAFVSFLLGMGPHLPGGGVVHEHLGLDWFRYPARFFFLALPGLALASAHGAARAAALVASSRVRPRRAFAAATAALGLGALVGAARPEALGPLADEAGLSMLRGAALAALVGLWTIAACRNERRRRTVLSVFAFLLAFDLLSRPLAGFVSADWARLSATPLPAPLSGLSVGPGPPPRVFGEEHLRRAAEREGGAEPPERALDQAHARLAPSAMELAGIQTMGRDGVHPLRSYERVLGALNRGPSPLDELLGIERRWSRAGWLRQDAGPVVSLERARAGGESPELLRAALEDPRSLQLAGLPVPSSVAASVGDCAEEGRAELTSWRAHDLRVTVEAPCPVLLVHWTSLAPGWRGEIDGRAAELAPALGAFQALVVPAGRHEARFVHEPPGLRAAAPVSLTALAIASWLVLRRPRREGGEAR